VKGADYARWPLDELLIDLFPREFGLKNLFLFGLDRLLSLSISVMGLVEGDLKLGSSIG